MYVSKKFPMKDWLKRFIFYLSFLCLFVIFSPEEGKGINIIKIGLLSYPRHNSQPTIKAFIRGAEMAVAEINSAEEKKGFQLLLLLWPDFPYHQLSLSELQEKIESDESQFLIGALPPEKILPIAQLARKKHIPFLAFSIDLMEFFASGSEPENLFWISPSPEAFQRAAVRQAAKLSKQRFFFLASDSKINRSWSKYFWEELRKLKPEAQAVGEIFLPEKVEDFDTYIKIILSAKPEICMSHFRLREWLQFAPKAKKQGYFKKIVHFELESGDLEFLASLGKEFPLGVWGVSAFPFWGLDEEPSKNFVDKFKKKNNFYPSLSALSGYASIYALVEAIKKGGTLNAERICQTLPGLNFPSPIGRLTIRASDRRTLWPIWCGVSAFSSPYPFAILKDLHYYGPDAFQP